ncbi:MAG: response regulator transcription factor [Syntrophomonadaceae bacterium]|jgi:two-component system response regulator CssR|nr:response regulator transcription factor [Syntrophomonadaceae bacterium]
MQYRITLVEDDINLNLVLASYLKQEGWEVLSLLNGQDAINAIAKPTDLWILDIMLPDIDGYRLLKEIKVHSPGIPVIFISARDADIDRIVGLELGGDDYLAKPFLPRELVIRSRKLLERFYNADAPLQILPPYSINIPARIVKENEQIIDLTSREFDLLVYFAQNRGQALSREQLINHIWGDDYYGTDRVVDDLIRRLRKKMPELRIETIYGYGYRMVKV